MAADLGNAELALATIGALFVARWVLYIVYDVLAAIRTFVWARIRKNNLAKTYGGKWAIVTGCTDGIGKEYARQLARRGMNILLISRNMDKLNDVQQLIKTESPGVETETVQVDFSHGRVVYPKIATSLQDKDIGILVNNVGVTVTTSISDTNDAENWNCINVNVGSVAAMTHLVLAKMVARNKGAIVNIVSAASSVPYGLYSATKAFGDFFSESLKWECRGTGVTIQTVRPGVVVTNMTASFASQQNVFRPNPTNYVSSALSSLGHSGRTTGYLAHGLQMFIIESLPYWFLNRTIKLPKPKSNSEGTKSLKKE